jgi:gliding motility-associated lipoprotein GldH
MFVTIDFPHGIQRVDTVDCLLADAGGKWYGKEKDDGKYESILLYRNNVRFPYAGKYVFTLEQAMRHKIMPGINKIGLRIEKKSK